MASAFARPVDVDDGDVVDVVEDPETAVDVADRSRPMVGAETDPATDVTAAEATRKPIAAMARTPATIRRCIVV